MLYNAQGKPIQSTVTPRNAQLSTKVVFYRDNKFKKLVVGFPEQFPAPAGWEKIVCNSAAEVERYSQEMREQDALQERLTDEEREAVEGPMRRHVRAELQHRLANARNNVNRDFLRFAIAQIDAKEDKVKAGMGKRESYMHAEAFEKGK